MFAAPVVLQPSFTFNRVISRPICFGVYEQPLAALLGSKLMTSCVMRSKSVVDVLGYAKI